MKKLFAVLVALTLVLSMGTIVFAADTWTGSITINSSDSVSVNGKNFKAYQILEAEAVDANDLSKGVIYFIPAGMQSFYNELCGGEDGKATVDEVTAYICAATTDLQDFAVAALAAAKTATGLKTATAIGAADKATFTDLPFGYYVIEDEGTATPISALMLRSTSEEVIIKADKPAIEKKIDGAKDGDKTTDGLVDYNTAAVGEKVPYVLTSKVPDMTGYKSYTYTVTDTFSEGLTFNNDVAVTIGGVEYKDYTVATNGQVVTITFNNMIALNTPEKIGKEIKITYSATVNENAIVGVEGNPNTVKLTYSNNPQSNTTENTKEDKVYTYLVDLIINKTGPDGKTPLPGAEFAIKQGDTTLATGTSDATGKVVFKWVDKAGLKDGETYTIVETKAPAGYNEAKDIEFTVTCTYPAADATNANCNWNSSNDSVTFTVTETAAADDYFETTVINKTGTLLPETGGIGTTIFYVVGGLLMVAAFVLLVSKKRMASFA